MSASDGAVTVPGVGDASFLAGDDSASYCAVVNNGEVTCWGQLGAPTGAPATVPGLANVTSLAGSSRSFCGVLHGGQVDCWGTNDNGRLGIGNSNFDYSTAKPVRVTGIGSVRNLAVSGDDRYCAALVSGGGYCWGGITPYDTDSPVQISNVSGAVSVVADDSGTFCAIERRGALACWGWDSNGELGDGTVGRFSSTAVAVKGLGNVTSVVGTGFTFSAIVSGGSVYCWGSSNAGQAGQMNPGRAPVLTPVQVQGLSGATELSGGNDAFCARMARGSVACWGWDNGGELGNGGPTWNAFGNTISSPVPYTVDGITAAASLDVGNYTAGEGPLSTVCTVVQSGGVECWGDNGSGGLLGAGTQAYSSSTPVPVVQAP